MPCDAGIAMTYQRHNGGDWNKDRPKTGSKVPSSPSVLKDGEPIPQLQIDEPAGKPANPDDRTVEKANERFPKKPPFPAPKRDEDRAKVSRDTCGND